MSDGHTGEWKRIAATTPDIAAERIAALETVFPEAFSEGRVDFDRLRAALGEMVDGGPERYSFTWAGKRGGIRAAQTPSAMTLKPDRKASLHFDETAHTIIEGDNLEVLKILYKSYHGRVKMIYIDPPYNTEGDFVYRDDFAAPREAYLRQTGQVDTDGNYQTSNIEMAGRKHSNWLTMMYPRLFLARQLLRDDGVIFISTDDIEVHNLRLLMNEVFGEENFLGTIIWKKKTNGNNMGFIPPVHDYITVYARSALVKSLFPLPLPEEYIRANYSNPDNHPRGDWTTQDLAANHEGPYFPITNPKTGTVYYPPAGRYWVFNEQEVARRIADRRIIFGRTGMAGPTQRKFKDEATLTVKAESLWDNVAYNSDGTDEFAALLGAAKVFDNPKPTKLLKQLLRIGCTANDLVLDFFAGSGSIAQAVLELNQEDGGDRRFILVQLPERTPEGKPARIAGYNTIADITRERVRRVVARMEPSIVSNSDSVTPPPPHRYPASARIPSRRPISGYGSRRRLTQAPTTTSSKLPLSPIPSPMAGHRVRSSPKSSFGKVTA